MRPSKLPRLLLLALLISTSQLSRLALGKNPLGPPSRTSTGHALDFVGGLADPHIHLLNGSFHLFSTHDLTVTNPTYVNTDWWIWSSPDLVSWEKSAVVRPLDALRGWIAPTQNQTCWATDGAFRNGRFYFYMSVGGKARNASWDCGVIAVTSAPAITGPWTDPIGLPLVTHCARDPGVVKDAQGEYYLVSGVFQYFIQRFNPDMVSFAEPPRKLVVVGALGPFGKKRQKSLSLSQVSRRIIAVEKHTQSKPACSQEN